MKLKVYVVDLEIPRTIKRWILMGVGGTVALVGIAGGATLVWAGNPMPIDDTWIADGGVVSAGELQSNLTALQAQITALQASAVPSGAVVAFPGSLANMPVGWVACDGATYDGSLPAYAALYAAIRVANGGMGSAMKFNVPDYRGYFLRGLDPSGVIDPDVASRSAAPHDGNSGPNVGSKEADSMISHTHTVYAAEASLAIGLTPNQGYGAIAGTAKEPITSGVAGTSTETRPKNVAVYYIIKL